MVDSETKSAGAGAGVGTDSVSHDSPDGQTSHGHHRHRRNKSAIRYRSVSNGFWVTPLLPIAIYFSSGDTEFQSFTAIAIITFNAFLLSVFRYLDLNLPFLLRHLRTLNICFSVATMIICVVLGATGAKIYEVASYVVLNFSFPYVFYNIIKQYPKSFSFGEGVLVTSAFAYRFWGASQKLPFPPTDIPIYALEENVIISMFLQLVFFGSILGARIILLLQKPWKLFILEEMLCLWSKYSLMAFFTRIPTQSDEVSEFLLWWPFEFLFKTDLRVRLFVYWAVVSFVTGVFFVLKTFSSEKSTTIDRKLFHFSMIFVFLPGIFWDHAMIYCCSSVLYFLFALVEAVRVLKFEVLGVKVGDMINDRVKDFRDHQDEGKLLLTPIYLLAGCSLPVWLTGLHVNQYDLHPIQYMAALSGVLSVGIGDTFASIGGSMFGRTHWKHSRKTVEGSVCSIVAQMVATLLIVLSGVIPHNPVTVAAMFVGIVVNAVVEGVTDQIDNLILPLLTFIVVHLSNVTFNYIL